MEQNPTPPELSESTRNELLQYLETHRVEDEAREEDVPIKVSKKTKKFFIQFRDYIQQQLGVTRLSFSRTLLIVAEFLQGKSGAQLAVAIRNQETLKILTATNRSISDMTYVRDSWLHRMQRTIPVSLFFEWLKRLSNNNPDVLSFFKSHLRDGFVAADFEELEGVMKEWVQEGTITTSLVASIQKVYLRYLMYDDFILKLLDERAVQDGNALAFGTGLTTDPTGPPPPTTR